MPRIRSVKPDFFTSESVAELSFRARLTWIGLWTHADDEGRCRDNARLVQTAVWPLDPVTEQDVEDDLAELAKRGRLLRYVVDGRRYLQVPNFREHQHPNRPTPSKFPPPDAGTPWPPADLPPASRRSHGGLTESLGSAHTQDSAAPTSLQVNPLSEDSVSAHGAFSEGSLQEGRGEEGRGGEDARAREQPTNPRDARCTAHTGHPSPPPCHGCRAARERVERNTRDAATSARLATARCTWCDGEGWRVDPENRHRGPLIPGVRCDHTPMPSEAKERSA